MLTLPSHVNGVNMSEVPYHHGNLATTMLDAAHAMLEHMPAEKIGLREIARQLGVSASASYRHFGSREALMAALAARGFRQLSAELDRAAALPGDTPALQRLGRAYVRFALANRNLFDLMMRHPRDGTSPDLESSTAEAFSRLSVAVSRLTGTHQREATVGAWALVHGLAILISDRQLAEDLMQDDTLDRLVEVTTATYLAGLTSSAPTS